MATAAHTLPVRPSVPTDRFLAAIVESSDDAIIGKTLEGTITSWNRGAEMLYGYSAVEAVGQPIALIIPPERPSELPAIMEQLRRGERIDHYETVRVHKDGTRLDVSVSISPIRDDTERIVGAASIGRNITERKHVERTQRDLEHRAQQELAARRASEARFRAVWEATSEALALSDSEGVVLAVNPAYCALYGRTAEAFVGHSFARIFPATDRADAIAQYRAIFVDPDPPRSYETRVRRPDGTECAVEVRADFLERDGQRVAMISAIRDVTERKRLEQAQQDFVAMASHDLATPLTVLRARAQLLQRRELYDADSVASILEQTSRMERLITDLRELVQVESGRLPLRRESLDLGHLVHEAVARAQAQRAEHAIGIEAPGHPIIGSWDRDRLAQVLDNLLGNAVKYSPEGGAITVSISREAREAQVRVQDQGIGIAEDVVPRLFERFFQGQEPGVHAGLGLGLYIARMLVEAHGGRIWAESEPGAGSTFTIALPLEIAR